MRIPRKSVPLVLLAALSAVLCFAPSARACDVPVFRYALERWQPGRYNLIVFNRGKLDGDANTTVTWLSGLARDPNRPCNLGVYSFDVAAAESGDPNAAMPAVVLALWEATCKDKPLPRMVACYPGTPGRLIPAWSGPVTPQAARALVDSPVRRKIVEAIVKGESVVWVLLECGDKAKDSAAAELMTDQLAKLQKAMALPDSNAPGADLAGIDYSEGPPIRIGFSMVRVRRDDPAEAALAQMLLGTEDDLAEAAANEPAAFAVFGQGRSMLALLGAGINRDNLAQDAGFLCGACSCMVKEQNPGVDLLFAADWYAPFRGMPAATSPLPDVIAPPATMPATMQPASAVPAGPAVVNQAAGYVEFPLAWALLLAVGVIAVAGVSLAAWVVLRGGAKAGSSR